MSDFATVWRNDTFTGDWALQGTQLLTGGDLITDMLIQIFSDRQAEPDDVIPDGTTDPRGWWGDFGAAYRVGSRMWLLNRSKKTPDVLLRAKDYIAEALQHLIDDGVVVKFDIVPEFVSNQLRVGVTAWRKDGSTEAHKFSWVWGVLTPST